MTSKLIAIEPMCNYMRVELNFGYVCNYNCPYCFDRKNFKDSKWLEWEYIQKFIEKIIEGKNDVMFALASGGEPTYYPHITKVLEFLSDYNVSIVSNGSRSIKWWEKHLSMLNDIAITYHCTEVDKDKFLSKIKWLTSKKHITIIIPLLKQVFWEQYEYAKILVKECDDIFISFKPLINEEKKEEFYYTEEQTEYSLNHQTMASNKCTESNSFFNINLKQIFDDGMIQQNIRPHTLIIKNQNNFKGWKCWSGKDSIRIDGNGNISRCAGSSIIANIYDKNYEIPTEPFICETEHCICIPQIRIRKEKYDRL